MQKKKNLPLLEKVEILDAGAEGKAIARVDKMVIFIPYVVPGDVVDVQLTRKKNSYAEGWAVKFHEYSDKRTEPRCEHFGFCGGCKWQNMKYNQQLVYKQKQVSDNFIRIGKLEFDEISPILASEKEYYYRNKLEYTFANRKWFQEYDPEKKDELNPNGLGFHLPGKFDRILDIEHCYLQPDPSNEIRLAVRAFALKEKLDFYDVRKKEGFLRNLIIRNTGAGDWMLIMVFNNEDDERIEKMMNFIRDKFPQVKSLMYIINPKRNDDLSDLEVRLFSGDPFITEEMKAFREGDPPLQFRIGPLSFFQTNTRQAERLYRIAADFAGFTGNEVVYDLYTGTGTIASYIARSVAKVVGIEYVASAIEDAKENAKLNGLENTSFFAGDIIKILNEDFILENGKPDIIITDPPRSGMHEKVIEQILSIAPEKVVYISCNPATQARDLAMMKEAYEIRKIQPVDMFPHTQHVENVVLLEKVSRET